MPRNHIFPISNCASLKAIPEKHVKEKPDRFDHQIVQFLPRRKTRFRAQKRASNKKCVSEHNYSEMVNFYVGALIHAIWPWKF